MTAPPSPEPVNFTTAEAGDEAYTYELPDGELVYGEFAFVTELEFFDERDEEIRLRRKRWRLVAVDELVLPDPYPITDDDDNEIYVCEKCAADWWISADAELPDACDTCGGRLIPATVPPRPTTDEEFAALPVLEFPTPPVDDPAWDS